VAAAGGALDLVGEAHLVLRCGRPARDALLQLLLVRAQRRRVGAEAGRVDGDGDRALGGDYMGRLGTRVCVCVKLR
jgi:hypothetical protein